MSTATKQLFDDEAEPMSTDLQPYAPPNPLTMLEAAIERGIGPDELGKLMDLCERHERNQAAAAFGLAVSKFQHSCPPVEKSRTAVIRSQKGEYKYQYAGFDDVMATARPHLSACGIAVGFTTEANDKGIRVTTRIRVGIHAEDYTLDVPVPAMNVNDTQRYGAALSYAKRYGLCAALNIVCTEDVDNDASTLTGISVEQEMQLLDLLDQFPNPADEKQKFLTWQKIDRVVDLQASRFDDAMTTLRGRLSRATR